MNKPTDTSSQEYLLYCAARRLIRDIRNEPTQKDREQRFNHITRRWSKRMQEEARALVRELWDTTNAEDNWKSNNRRGSNYAAR